MDINLTIRKKTKVVKYTDICVFKLNIKYCQSVQFRNEFNLNADVPISVNETARIDSWLVSNKIFCFQVIYEAKPDEN